MNLEHTIRAIRLTAEKLAPSLAPNPRAAGQSPSDPYRLNVIRDELEYAAKLIEMTSEARCANPIPSVTNGSKLPPGDASAPKPKPGPKSVSGVDGW